MSMPSEPGALPETEDIIPLCIPEIRGNEWTYIKECLDTGWVSSVGSFVNRLQDEIRKSVGANYAVATVNGTSALHIALIVAGVQPEDEVLVSTLTFIAPANAIRYAGAWPVFVDAEPEYWQMDLQKLTDFCEKECRWKDGALINRTTGRRIRALLPVHVLGHPVDMDPVLELARKYDLAVVEDSAESLGATYKGRHTAVIGDVGCFSFNGNKTITTGGGGMIVTDREDWARRARYLTTQAKDDPLEYHHGEIGYNYRLSNIQAAMGCAQLELLDTFIAAKRHIADTYQEALKDVPGLTPMAEAPWAFATYWMYTVLVDPGGYGMESRVLLRKLQDQGILTRPLWQPIHLSKAHRGCQATNCEVAERLNRLALSLPCSVGLKSDQQKRVLEAILSNSRAGAGS